MTVDVVAAYEEHGYVVVPGVVEPEVVADAGRHIDWLAERHPDVRPERLDHTILVEDPFAMWLAAHPGILDVVERFLGPDIALFAAHYISKPPGDGQPVLWHQDAAYWPLEPMDVISVWLAVDDADVGNGCMRVIPGSHRGDVVALRSRDDVDNVLRSEMTEAVDESAAVALELRAGDIELHHPNIVHGSAGNSSDRRRAGLTLRYIPTTTRVLTDRIRPVLLRGDAVAGVNDYAAPPPWEEGVHFRFTGCEALGRGR